MLIRCPVPTTMLKFLSAFLSAKPQNGESSHPAHLPTQTISADGIDSFPVARHLAVTDGFPRLDWDASNRWIDAISGDEAQAQAWARLERAWLEHLAHALGPHYQLRESGNGVLLSPLSPKVADATLAFMTRTLGRIARVLDGIAQVNPWGKDILIVFEDEESYYRYVSYYYPDSGDFAASGGMYINSGCGHFVTFEADLRQVEPVIAHEMTHGCLGHLPIPLWLNEGLAVNTEQRLCPPGPPMFTPMEMHAKHQAFWGEAEIQEFWSGKSFQRNDDGNLLSYDLARILVSQFSADWPGFQAFVLTANAVDGGAAAAAECLGHDLGVAASAILEAPYTPAWHPNPRSWITDQ